MRLLAGRLVRLVVVAFVVSLVSFSLLSFVEGDPALRLAGMNPSEENIARIRADLGLDRSFFARYSSWLGGLFRGDLGESYINAQSAWQAIRNAFPKTLELMILSQIVSIAVAVPLAIRSARRPGGFVDRVSSASAFGLLALPSFVLGIFLVALFAVRLDWFPAAAVDIPGLNDDPVSNLRQMFLPTITLAAALIAVYLRLLRSDLIDTLQQDYIQLARARGLSERRILWRHALRPSSFSLLTAVGINTAGLIGGTLIIESLFGIPGMGLLVVRSISSGDVLIVQALVLIFSIAFVVLNFAVDMLYAVADPRIRHGRA